MKKRLIAGTGVVLSAVTVAALVWPRGGTPVERQKVVDDFRRTSAGTETGDDGDASRSSDRGSTGRGDPPPAIPARGVYTYLSSGHQEMKFGPLPTETRVVPAQIVASITEPATGELDNSVGGRSLVAANCFDYELNLFAEHIEKTTFCASLSKEERGAELFIVAHAKRMKVGPATATAALECESPLVMAEGATTKGVPCSLTLNGGPMEVRAELSGSLSVGSSERLEIGGRPVSARPVSIEYLASGKVTGTWSEKVWVSDTDWLPVKVVREISLSGSASIKENSELTLKSLDPSV